MVLNGIELGYRNKVNMLKTNQIYRKNRKKNFKFLKMK